MSSAGRETIDLAARAGLELDPWQKYVLEDALGERPDGRWAATQVGLIVARQNGKGAILEARQLAGLFLFGESVLIHSAHEFKTSKQHFRRILRLIESTPEFDARVARVHKSHGEEGIELKSGARLLFATRTSGGGRGFSGAVLFLDEAYNLTDDGMAALAPTLATEPNYQIWYTTSAPDKDLAPCEVISRARTRALSESPGRLAWFEWSAQLCTDSCGSDCAEHDDPDAPETVRRTNPGLGVRLNHELVEDERAGTISRRAYIRERLSVGRYVVDSTGWEVADSESWEACRLPVGAAPPRHPVAFGLDINPERTMGAISVAGVRPDGTWHMEVVNHLPGTTWMVDRMAELKRKWKPCAVVVGNFGPAGSLIPELDEAGIRVIKASTGERAAAAGLTHDAIVRPPDAPRTWRPRLRHIGQPALTSAMAAATKITLGKDGAFVWGRNSTSADISPLVAGSAALWGLKKFGNRTKKPAAAWA
ncbi:hypothetical protein GCM10027160_29060 [Streptomyces calidiresistens]|uniref:Terminase n=1 Tax=Streptomyces calidiresistens TaxID=1485586 RepID=A0A7W3T037_9ACTN|nr:terminase [Streptomyces calidiresistens]MBB0228524.1 terminase [Streptomyces calidiresistens]